MRAPFASFAVALALALLAPVAALSQTTLTSVSAVGSGPQGYDWLLGTWDCVNSVPSAIGGPANTSFVASHAGSGVLLRLTGKNFDGTSYLSYIAKTKTWWNPSSYSDGGSSVESTRQTGKTVVFAGTFTDSATGSSTRIRDTYTTMSSSKFTDLSAAYMGGVWKVVANTTCTRS
jgi:hypothetical protein